MLRDNLVELIEPMLNSAGADPLALYIHTRTPASDDRLPCLKNPRPEGPESSLTESASSPFQAEPAHWGVCRFCCCQGNRSWGRPSPTRWGNSIWSMHPPNICGFTCRCRQAGKRIKVTAAKE